ncbi:hypothetical protein BZA77DRAFT_128732 [Pyronema omphalodes]|nr:hypothetical protein BZA77DRAFT_128732 [Pyronema omphalodes]
MATSVPRGALHQRTDSDTNVLAGSNSGNGSGSVSAKSSDVASRPSTASTKNSKRHKSKSSNGSNSTTRSNTARSATSGSASLESLPPVPPLRIQKHHPQPSFSIYCDDDAMAGPAGPATGAAYEEAEYDTNESDLVELPVEEPIIELDEREDQPMDERDEQVYRRQPTFPRSILKKPSQAALPPYTEDDYSYKSSVWHQTSVPTTRMPAQTLRLVNASGTNLLENLGDLPGSQPESSAAAEARSARAVRGGSNSPETVRMVPPGTADTLISRGSRSPETVRLVNSVGSRIVPSTTPPLASMNSPRPITPPHPVAIPAWARYFYSRGGRTSVLLPPHMTPSPHLASSASRPVSSGIAEIPFYIRSPQADSTTLYSLPHLDRFPTHRLETFDRQILLFCFGFIMPLCWFIAAVLPLPPTLPAWAADAEERGYGFVVAKEQRIREQGYERRWENARWWRRVNRGMSLIGIGVVIAVITVAVIATKR